METLSVGIIGAGWVASARHIPAYVRDSRARVEAIYDPDIERARAAARRFKINHATDDVVELLERARDVVSVCTPPTSHAELTVRALSAGRHVLVEKPMAMSSTEAQSMVAAAERNNVRLCVSHNFLFSRSMLKARELVGEGKLGAVQHAIALQLSSPRRRLPLWYPDLPGGLFFDEAPHMIYLLRNFLGDLTTDGAWSAAAPAESPQTVDRIDARLTSAAASAHLTMSFRAPVSEWLLTVVGDRRVLVIDVFRDILTVLRPDGGHGRSEVLLSSLGVAAQAARGFLTSGALHASGRLLYGHDVLVSRFLDSIAGAEPPVSGREGLAVVETMESILSASSLADQPAPADQVAA